MTDHRVHWIDRAEAAESIRKMNEDDLRFLNRLIVDRLNLIHQARSTVLLSHFGVGERVKFPTSSGDTKSGVIVRLNKKTASIMTDDGQHWNVHPSFLSADKPENRPPVILDEGKEGKED